MTQDRIAQVAGLFDAVAPTYDQVGVDFFGPIARHLVGPLDPHPGEQVIELGCGRGALTLPLAGRRDGRIGPRLRHLPRDGRPDGRAHGRPPAGRPSR
jgi:ubiquinone/menaquinone biosynthesis C-methylase UbiE